MRLRELRDRALVSEIRVGCAFCGVRRRSDPVGEGLYGRWRSCLWRDDHNSRQIGRAVSRYVSDIRLGWSSAAQGVEQRLKTCIRSEFAQRTLLVPSFHEGVADPLGEQCHPFAYRGTGFIRT